MIMFYNQKNFRFFLFLLCLLICRFTDAQVTVDPFGFAVSIEANDNLQTEMTLNNHNDQDISFAVSLEEIENDVMGLNANLLRNAFDLRGPARDRRGEPDDAGYFWVDNNEDDGPEFNWIDIVNRDGAQRLQIADNINSGELELGFEFPWYGEWYPSIRVCSNGWFTFDPEQDGIFANLPQFPNENEPNNILAVDCLDLMPINQSSMWFWTDGEGIAVISWLMMTVRLAPVRPDITMQAVLIAETGTVLYQYGNQMGLPVNQINIGYENQIGELGANILFHQAVGQGTAIAISGPFAKWLLIEPLEGEIPAEDSRNLDVTFLPEDMEPGTYEMRVYIELTDMDDESPTVVEISAVMTVDDPVNTVAGVISDRADGQPVEGATVMLDRYKYARMSNEEGNYRMADLPLGEYSLAFTAPDYLPHIEDINLEEGEDYELNVALLHAICNPDVEELSAELAPDTDTEIEFNITNDGNGPLSYVAERKLLGDADADPWMLRQSRMVGENRDDSRIQGVIFANDRFYVAGANDGEPAIYIFDRNGDYVDLFDQPGEDRRGMKDLAWDGVLIWGAISSTIYGFTVEGEVITSFESPVNPTANLAWDPVNQWLWVSSTTTDFVAVDTDGNEHGAIDHGNLRSYGLAWWQDDPDNYPLYIFAKEMDPDRSVVYKANPDDGDIQLVEYLDNELGGSPQAAFITNQYDIYSWVFIAIANASANEGGDRIDIWQLDARTDWMQLEPIEGVIQAEDTEEFVLTLDATGLPNELFEGELVFTHDGVGNETIIPVSLNVAEGPVHAEQTLDLDIGWNMVSVYLQPDEENVVELTRDLVDNDLLIMMKDGMGRFYSPEFNFNNIPGWDVAQGYLIKMRQAAELTLEGMTVTFDTPIDLFEGWQMISYYPRDPVDAIIALSGLGDALIMAKDGSGRFYIREWGFSNMGDMRSGQGYLIKMARDAELTYRLHAEEDELFAVNHHQKKPVHLPVLAPTGSSMSLLVIAEPQLSGEIGAYTQGELVGSSVLNNGRCGLAVWGDDPSTEEIDGAVEGESLTFKLWDGEVEWDLIAEWIKGDESFITDGFTVLKASFIPYPSSFILFSAYPNPFNNLTRIEFGLPEASCLTISVYDISGRLITHLIDSKLSAGHHTAVWDAADASTGVYLVRLESDGFNAVQKVILVK